MPFTILLRRDVFVDPRRLVDVVSPAIRLNPIETKMLIRKSRGIFLENLEEEPARRISEALAKENIENFVVPREEIPDLPAPRRIAQIERAEGRLDYRAGGSDAVETMPWDSIHVISLGVVARPEYKGHYSGVRFDMVPPLHSLGEEREIVRENLILKMRSAKTPGRVKDGDPHTAFERIEQKHGAKVRVYCDIVTEGLGTWLRASLDDLAYAYSEPVPVKLGGIWAFEKLFIDAMKARLDALTEMTLKILDAEDISDLVFAQPEEFNRYTSWAAVLRHVRPEEKTPWAEFDTSWESAAPPAPSTESGSSSSSPPATPTSTSP